MKYILRIGKILTVAILFGCILVACEYDDYYNSQQLKSLKRVSQDNYTLPYLTGVTVWVLPDKEKLTELNNAIKSAKKRIWIEIYSWTEKSTLESVLEAKRRGIDVQVILEGNVYGAPEINRKTYESLTAEGIRVRYANNSVFTFTHAKFWIIDDVYFISTGNLSYSAFTSNRELILIGRQQDLLSALVRIFQADIEYGHFDGEIPSGLFLAPDNIRFGIENSVKLANESVYIYVQSFSDEILANLLKLKAKQGVQITLCIADKGTDDTSDETTINNFSGTTILVKKIKKPYPHIKFFNIDNDIWFIGSANFTQNALDNNREIGLIFHSKLLENKSIIKILEKECPVRKK